MRNTLTAVGLSATAVALIATAVVVADRDGGAVQTSTFSTPRDRGAPAPSAVVSRGTWDLSSWTDLGFGQASEVEHYEDVATMARSATVVVDAEVQRVYPTRIVGQEGRGADADPGVQYVGLELRVHQVLAGRLWNETDTGGRTVVETLGSPSAVSADGPTRGVFFLVHKRDRLVPGVPAPSADPGDPPGEEKYYRFISSQGLLVEDPEGVPVFPLSSGDSTNGAVRRSVTDLSYDEVVAGIS